jgi:prohibitin 2
MLVQRAKDFQIIVDEVSIPHLEFSKDYTAAVEAKQVAQQDAERAKYIVVKALEEKKAIVIKAEGEARSGKLILENIILCGVVHYIAMIFFYHTLYYHSLA